MSYILFICIHCELYLISNPNFDSQDLIFILVLDISSIVHRALYSRRNFFRDGFNRNAFTCM